MTAAGATIVAPAEPRDLAPEGYRMPNGLKGGAMEVQDSTVVRFISAGRDEAGLHSAVFTDPANCAFPPMTLFTAVDVQIGAFEYDGTEALLTECKLTYGGRAPTPVPDASRGGRLHVGRQQLIEWVSEQVPPLAKAFANEDPTERQRALDYFHKSFLPLGVESTIYTVNRTLVTVQATYLLPAAVEAAAAEAGGAGAGVAGGSSGGGGPGKAGAAVTAKHMGDSEKVHIHRRFSGLLRACKVRYGGRAPTPVPEAAPDTYLLPEAVEAAAAEAGGAGANVAGGGGGGGGPGEAGGAVSAKHMGDSGKLG
jgi:hypothetical protein